jgi:hypothetical protein
VVPELLRVADVSPDIMPSPLLSPLDSCGLVDDARTTSFTSPIRLPELS